MRRTDQLRGMVKAAEELKERFSRYAALPRFNDDFEEAFEYYFGERAETIQDQLGEEEYGRFIEWFTHDYALRNGRRLTENFEVEYGAELTRPMRRLLRSWSQSHLTLLEFRLNRGETYQFVDILTGDTHYVISKVFPGGLPPWSVVIGRPLPVGRRCLLSSGYTVVPPAVKTLLVPMIRGEFRRWRLRNGGGARVFLRQNGHLFNDFLVELEGWIASTLTKVAEAQKIIPSLAVFRVRDAERVRERLIACPEVEEVGRGVFLLFEKGRPHGKRHLLAEVLVKDGRLRMKCSSAHRLQEMKDDLEQRCFGLLHHLLDVYYEPTQPTHAGTALLTLERGETPLQRVGLVEAIKQIDYANAVSARSPEGNLARQPVASLSPASVAKVHGRRKMDFISQLRHVMAIDNSLHPKRLLECVPDQWDSEAQRAVIDRVNEMLPKTAEGLGQAHLADALTESAAWLWWYFCCSELPRLRKPDAWAAAVHYAVSYVEQWDLTQVYCARLYGVSPASVSKNAARIIDRLQLTPFDDRLCVRHPLDALFGEEMGGHDPNGSSLSKDEAQRGIGRGFHVAAQVRAALFDLPIGHDALQGRAERLFADQADNVPTDLRWHEAFLDWYHFDWPVPVMGGRTLARTAVEEKRLPADMREILAKWLDAHPSFYRVERELRDRQRGKGYLLTDLVDGSTHRVDTVPLITVIRPGEIIFARLVPVDEARPKIVLGVAIAFPAAKEKELREAIVEERELVERWIGASLSWDEFRRRYAERLYAVAFRADLDESATSFDDD